ncbi:NUDIX hydrolase [Propioniciclava soli]|uniref:NUDIX hydrolase n=1 Tax=Propioniciclava soli TaxID=2775081 RepID=A0ABZ3C7W9_9ACTN|nr:NUDIX hydrolase [Propioniciclava soli]
MDHRVAFCVLVRDDTALLVHRHPDRRWYPDVWDLPGGHLEEGEDPSDAARRELTEEVGVVATQLELLRVPVDVPGTETHAFVARAWSGEPMNMAPHEHDQIGWFTLAEVEHLDLAVPELVPLVRRALALDT